MSNDKLSKEDIALGMSQNITRRDIMMGAAAVGAVAATGSLVTAGATFAQQSPGDQYTPGYYPPALQGLRGSHPGV